MTFVHGESKDPLTGAVQLSPPLPNRRTGGRSAELSHYVCAGRAGAATAPFEPSLVTYGFQYLQVWGLGGPDHPATAPQLTDLTCYTVHTDLSGGDVDGGGVFFAAPPAATPSLGDHDDGNLTAAAVLTAVQAATRATALANYASIPTDCPTRERRGWMGDMLAAHRTLMANWDMAAPYTKWLRDIRHAQAAYDGGSGAVPEIVPAYFAGVHAQGGDPAWAAGYVLLLDAAWRHFGDVSARLLPRVVWLCVSR